MKASCQCGQLRAEVSGPTIAVVACHCLACQKRTGSPFGEAAYWPHEEVLIQGEATQFDRPTDLGGVFSQSFCPHCGATVYMRGMKNATMTGVPIGLFDDPHSMKPIRSAWEQTRHTWVGITTADQHFPRARMD